MFCLGSMVTFTLINVSLGKLLENTGLQSQFGRYRACWYLADLHFVVLLLAKKDTFHSSAEVLHRKICSKDMLVTTSQMYSVITERHWRHSLRVLILWPLGVDWFCLHYLPGLYSSKLSEVFLSIHQHKLQRCSALTVNGLGSVCCKCLCYVATVVYVCRLLMWKWMIKLDVVA